MLAVTCSALTLGWEMRGTKKLKYKSKADGNELGVSGKCLGFAHPNLQFSVPSSVSGDNHAKTLHKKVQSLYMSNFMQGCKMHFPRNYTCAVSTCLSTAISRRGSAISQGSETGKHMAKGFLGCGFPPMELTPRLRSTKLRLS